MNPRISRLRLTTSRVAILLACGTVTWAQADRGDATPGIQSSVNLPAKSQGKPAPWAGKAFRQGVVSAANPYAAEAGRRTVIIDSRRSQPARAFDVLQPSFSRRSLQGVPGMVRGTDMALKDYTPLHPSTSALAATSGLSARGHEQAAGADIQADRRAWRGLLTGTCLKRAATSLGIIQGQMYNQPNLDPIGKSGSMTLADLEQYQAKLRIPIEGSYRGHRIKSMPPSRADGAADPENAGAFPSG